MKTVSPAKPSGFGRVKRVGAEVLPLLLPDLLQRLAKSGVGKGQLTPDLEVYAPFVEGVLPLGARSSSSRGSTKQRETCLKVQPVAVAEVLVPGSRNARFARVLLCFLYVVKQPAPGLGLICKYLIGFGSH